MARVEIRRAVSEQERLLLPLAVVHRWGRGRRDTWWERASGKVMDQGRRWIHQIPQSACLSSAGWIKNEQTHSSVAGTFTPSLLPRRADACVELPFGCGAACVHAVLLPGVQSRQRAPPFVVSYHPTPLSDV